jgi:hypothetical protein
MSLRYTIRLIFLLLVALLSGLPATRSQDLPSLNGREPESLRPEELFVLSSVPLLELPDTYKGSDAPLLPGSIDNSTQPYFRPITSQSGFECGQSAGVAFNFTYEMDRIRNVPANVPAYQYPTHFVWDFLNNGDNYVGASFFDSWEIVRACGTMNVTDYGGQLNTGGYKRWISGYDMYYNGMHNRLTSVKAIRCDTPEGLQTLKYWLYDHLEGSPVGGVANFYAQYYGSVATTLPPGTPEAGQYVQTSFGGSPSHAWTVVGFNDSIRFDYNNDGQYTNNLDINSDGLVDMHDWEIGGLRFASGYAGPGWCNGGFCYLMYKTLADNAGYGGIWNHTVYVLDVKQTCNPQLTMKVSLKHVNRNRVRVTVGISTDPSAQYPSAVFSYPIFSNQGGPYYMQGGTTEADKTIEFGLDLAPALSMITSGQPVKYFLQVQETDPGNLADGSIISAALVDYTGSNPVTIDFPSTNVPLVNNDITRISLVHSTGFSKPLITSMALPMANLYQPYSTQLTAIGGAVPYQWDVQLDYPESTNAAAMPNPSAQQLTLTNNNNGYAVKTLDFNLPFFKKNVNKVYVYADGYILFDDQPYTYPYLFDKQLLFRQSAIISPFMADLILYNSYADGVWYEGDASSATFRWKASITGMPGISSVNFAVKLYADGTIEFYYGNMNYPAGLAWTGGISGGDNKNYQYSMYSGIGSITTNTLDKFSSCQYPVEMTVSENGIFQGTPQSAYQSVPIKFIVTDNNGISSTKTLNFSCNGLQLDYSVNSGGDSLIENGEHVSITLQMTNIGSQPVQNTNAWISLNDPYITPDDTSEYLGTIGAGQTVTVPDAFSFFISPNIPDNHQFMLTFHVSSSSQSFDKQVGMIAFAPEIVMGEVEIPDGDNGRLDPGETTDIRILAENKGRAKVQGMNVLLSAVDTLITVNTAAGQIPLLSPDSSRWLTFNVTASPQAAFEHLYLMNAATSASGNFEQDDSIWIYSGEVVDDFETGTFNKFGWNVAFVPWVMDTLGPFEGTFSAKSGWIYDNMETGLYLTVNVLENGSISFYRKTACQDDPQGINTDFLAFYIDDTEYGRWDGLTPWGQASYPVDKGNHTFRWVYKKDASTGSYSDCAWIDFVTFPPFAGAMPGVSAGPAFLEKTLDPGQASSDGMQVENAGGGLLHYTVMAYDTSAGKAPVTDNLQGAVLTCNMPFFNPGQPFSWTFTVMNTSPDNEGIREIRMDVPQGVIVESSTNFSGGSLGELVSDGVTGNGATLTWEGENNGQGVIRPGESAVAVINGTAEQAQNFDCFIVYSVRGDSSGADPHASGGDVRIANAGLNGGWLSFSPVTGALLPGETAGVEATFNSTGLPPGDYYSDILVRDLFNNMVVIPAHLHVNQPIGIPSPGAAGRTVLLESYPNPFSSSTEIRYILEQDQEPTFEIFTVTGWKVCTLFPGTQAAGAHSIRWNGTDDHGDALPAGLYECRMRSGQYQGNHKLIIIR